MHPSQPGRNRSRQALLVALLISILLHQVILTGLSSLIPLLEEEVPEEKQQVVLRQEQPEPPPEPEVREPKPKEQVKKKPESRPKAEPMPRSRPKPPEKTANLAPSEEVPPMGPYSEPPPMATEPTPPTAPKLDLDWNSFETIFGDKSAVEREEYAERSLEQRRSRGAFGRFSEKVMRAIRTNQSFIKPGTQEPLGPRQVVFHNYIRQVHETSIHPLFADSFLSSLTSFSPSDPLNNMSLNMVAEFEIFESGQISEIRVVRSSGITVFDAGAVDSIYRSSPFPPPPKSVLSWNRRVYIRWGFYRNQRKCGVFNVEPYILRAPGSHEEPLSVESFTVDDS